MNQGDEIRTPMPRLIAMSRGCRLLHPECSKCECPPHGCELRKSLYYEESRLRRDLNTIDELGCELDAIPATVRPDWKKPQPPEVGYFLSVLKDGDEWHLHWFSASHSTDYIAIEGPDVWPFVEQAARTCDWQKLGITVIA